MLMCRHFVCGNNVTNSLAVICKCNYCLFNLYTDTTTIMVVDPGQPVSKKAKRTSVKPALQLTSSLDGNALFLNLHIHNVLYILTYSG